MVSLVIEVLREKVKVESGQVAPAVNLGIAVIQPIEEVIGLPEIRCGSSQGSWRRIRHSSSIL
jgi:hypothetical protein